MGKLRAFEVILEGENVNLYHAGDTINGFVRIVLAAPKKDIRGIQVIFKGKAKTQFQETEGSQAEPQDIIYKWEELYFEDEQILIGEDAGYNGADVQLNVGEHKFPFSFQLPTCGLPHAFEGKYGYVRYKIMAIIDRPWKFSHETQRLFSVVGIGLDLNAMPQLGSMIEDEVEKTVCCLCCESGPIKVYAEIDKTGYVPGEAIRVTGFVDNQTNRDIISCTIKLMQENTFHGRRGGIGNKETKKDLVMLASLVGDGCEGFNTASFERIPLLVPPCPASGLEGCNIIDIDYYVEFEADVSGAPFYARLKMPITIGTVPLRSSYPPAGSAPPHAVITTQPSAAKEMPPPPSYEVAVGGLQEIPSKSGHEYTFGRLLYAPRYPYYKFPIDSDSKHAHLLQHAYGPFSGQIPSNHPSAQRLPMPPSGLPVNHPAQMQANHPSRMHGEHGAGAEPPLNLPVNLPRGGDDRPANMPPNYPSAAQLPPNQSGRKHKQSPRTPPEPPARVPPNYLGQDPSKQSSRVRTPPSNPKCMPPPSYRARTPQTPPQSIQYPSPTQEETPRSSPGQGCVEYEQLIQDKKSPSQRRHKARSPSQASDYKQMLQYSPTQEGQSPPPYEEIEGQGPFRETRI